MVLSGCFLLSQKLVTLDEPVKDKEHFGAKIVVRKTLICSPELKGTTPKNTSVAGRIRKSVCNL